MIYFDHAATTPLAEHVKQVMDDYADVIYGNPSSIHQLGREARSHLDAARQRIAKSLSAKADEIYFTSGGTEANNLAIIGAALAHTDKGKHIITSAQEHHAVLHVMNHLETLGFTVTYLPVDRAGLVSLDDLEKAIQEDTILISIMMVNNETGVLQSIKKLAAIAAKENILFHTDAVQAYQKIPIDVAELSVDLLSVSAHKINGPKGVGALYKRKDVPIHPLLFGGQQEASLRAGTENLLGIIGFSAALEDKEPLMEQHQETIKQVSQLLIDKLQEAEVPFEVNGSLKQRTNYIVNIYFPWIKNDILLTNLDLEQIAISNGSACTAGAIQPSHVLTAMYGAKDPRINHSVRFSFGPQNTEEEIQKVADVLKRLYDKLG